jgi:hypothetical protein
MGIRIFGSGPHQISTGDFTGALDDAKQAQAAAPSEGQKQAIQGLIDRLQAKQDINK